MEVIMVIYSVYDEEFRHYGRVVKGLDCTELTEAMEKIDMPSAGTAYKPSIESLEQCALFDTFRDGIFGGMPVELGMCWGYNTKLNCLEYHRDSEFNLGSEDFILLLARQDEIEDYMLDTAKVKAFRVPAGVLVEVYATTLHYAPCHCCAEKGFRVLVALPRGTNTEKPAPTGLEDDKYLTARNKWLLPHPDSNEAKKFGFVGLKGINIDIAE